jgi:hypothetical protein
VARRRTENVEVCPHIAFKPIFPTSYFAIQPRVQGKMTSALSHIKHEATAKCLISDKALTAIVLNGLKRKQH